MNMISNFAAPAEFIDRISMELEAITTSWSRIASALSEAEEMFGSDSDAFKSILKATKFSRATATKLVKIARSDRLRTNAKILAKCQAWTTLYEITTLTDEQFEDLLASMSDGEIVTFGMVRKVKEKLEKSDPYKVAFTIRIDENALKGGLLDQSNELSRLMDLIAKIQDTVAYVRVDDADRFEKHSSRYFAAIKLEYDRLLKSHLRTALNRYRNNSSSWKSFKQNRTKARPIYENFGNEEDVRLAFVDNPAEVLEILGYDEFNIGKVWDAAQIAVDRRNEVFVRKANAPFCHANTILSEA